MVNEARSFSRFGSLIGRISSFCLVVRDGRRLTYYLCLAQRLQRNNRNSSSGRVIAHLLVKGLPIVDQQILCDFCISSRECFEALTFIATASTVINIPPKNPEVAPDQSVDLSKLCQYLPRHILACLLKENATYDVHYIIKAQKLMFHLAKFCKKKGGVLAQQVYLGIPKMIDASMLALVRPCALIQLHVIRFSQSDESFSC